MQISLRQLASRAAHVSQCSSSMMKFLLVLLFVTSVCAPRAWAVPRNDPGAPETNQILPALYVQNVFLKFMLAAYKKSDAEKIEAVKNAEKVIDRFAFQTRYIQQVANENEFNELRSRYFPEAVNVQDEVDLIMKGPPPPYLLLNGKTEEGRETLERQAGLILNRFQELSQVTDILSNATKSTTVRAAMYNVLGHPDLTRAAFSLVPDSARLQLANVVEGAYTKAIALIDSVGEQITTSGALKMDRRGQQRFFEIVLGEYFKGLALDTKLNMISAFIDHPEARTNRERFELMVMSAGPQFQKMLQAYAREKGINAELKDSLKKLEQSTKAAPWRLVRDTIYAQNVDFEWLEIKEKAVAAGTMAQVHKAKIKLRDGTVKTVAVRILKPGIRERVLEDSLALARIATILDSDPILIEENFPKLTPFFKGDREHDNARA